MAYSYNEILERMEDKYYQLSGYRADECGDIGIRLRVLAGEIFSMGTQMDWLRKQIFFSTASGEMLDLHAAARGLSRYKGKKAKGTVIIRTEMPAEYDISIPAATIFTNKDGSAFTEDFANSFVVPDFSEESRAAEVSCTRSAMDELSRKLFYHPESGDGDVEYRLEDADTISATVSYNDNEFNIIGQTLTVNDDKINVYHIDQVIYTIDESMKIFRDHQDDEAFWADGLDIFGKAEKEYGKALAADQQAVYAPNGDIVIATVREVPVNYTVSVQLNYKDNSRTINEAAGRITTFYDSEMTVKELEVNPCSVKLDLIYKDGSFNEAPDQTKENSITVTMKDGKAYTSSETPGYRSDNMERQTFKFTDNSGKRVVLDPENIQSIIYNGTELYNA